VGHLKHIALGRWVELARSRRSGRFHLAIGASTLTLDREEFFDLLAVLNEAASAIPPDRLAPPQSAHEPS
jgi:hypothetical protein